MLPFVYSSHRRKVLLSAIFCFCLDLICQLGDSPVAPKASSFKNDNANLTISDVLNTVTISRPQNAASTVSIEKHIDKFTLEFNIIVVLNDVKGIPLSDVTTVNFATLVSGIYVL